MLSAVNKQFRRPSGFLGRLISGVMKRGNRKDYDKILPALDIKPGDRILEIGYGHGLGVHRILSEHDCHVSGIDFSELMFKEAKKRNKKFIDHGRADLRFGNFLDMQLAPGLYDKVFCVNVIYFWNDLVLPFEQIRNGLKDGGVFCLFMFNADHLAHKKASADGTFNYYSGEHVISRLKMAGFGDIECRPYERCYVMTCKK